MQWMFIKRWIKKIRNGTWYVPDRCWIMNCASIYNLFRIIVIFRNLCLYNRHIKRIHNVYSAWSSTHNNCRRLDLENQPFTTEIPFRFRLSLQCLLFSLNFILENMAKTQVGRPNDCGECETNIIFPFPKFVSFWENHGKACCHDATTIYSCILAQDFNHKSFLKRFQTPR